LRGRRGFPQRLPRRRPVRRRGRAARLDHSIAAHRLTRLRLQSAASALSIVTIVARGGVKRGDQTMAEIRAPRWGWGRLAGYLFGRNALIGVASFMLLILSGYATWHGMRDFIIGVSSAPRSQGQLLPGGLSISNDALVIAVVVALTFLMWLMLRETFGAKRHL